MTNEDIIKGLTLMRKNFDSNSVYGSYCIDCLDAAIEALKEQPEHSQNTPQKQPDLNTLGIKTEETCEDVISRQAVIDALRDAENHAFNSFYKGLVKAHKIIADCPSAQTETCEGCKHFGKWENEVEYGCSSPCTRCKRRVEDYYER